MNKLRRTRRVCEVVYPFPPTWSRATGCTSFLPVVTHISHFSGVSLLYMKKNGGGKDLQDTVKWLEGCSSAGITDKPNMTCIMYQGHTRGNRGRSHNSLRLGFTPTSGVRRQTNVEQEPHIYTEASTVLVTCCESDPMADQS